MTVISILLLGATALHCASASRPFHHTYPGQLDPSAFPEPRHQRHTERLLGVSAASLMARSFTHPASAAASHVVSPADYGADPTGVQDSTLALVSAVAAMVALPGRTDDQNRVDLGGAVLDVSNRCLCARPCVSVHGVCKACARACVFAREREREKERKREREKESESVCVYVKVVAAVCRRLRWKYM